MARATRQRFLCRSAFAGGGGFYCRCSFGGKWEGPRTICVGSFSVFAFTGKDRSVEFTFDNEEMKMSRFRTEQLRFQEIILEEIAKADRWCAIETGIRALQNVRKMGDSLAEEDEYLNEDIGCAVPANA